MRGETRGVKARSYFVKTASSWRTTPPIRSVMPAAEISPRAKLQANKSIPIRRTPNPNKFIPTDHLMVVDLSFFYQRTTSVAYSAGTTLFALKSHICYAATPVGRLRTSATWTCRLPFNRFKHWPLDRLPPRVTSRLPQNDADVAVTPRTRAVQVADHQLKIRRQRRNFLHS